ncbi:laminin subunit gamma-3 isoform X2 [Nothobranchius furzeri]|uniref:laminin subunit gamma-3 isoform X2 n=1 Tax=Nothobranchius furzeri TaxID=105023 RepID=UPI003904B683
MDTSFTVSTPRLSTFLCLYLHLHTLARAAMDSCYDEEGVPSRCMPKFENIAFNRTAMVSRVCGSPPEDYCMQTGSTRSCHYCDASDPELHHNASLLTDFHRNDEPTWWQSPSMYYGIQYPNSVSVTLHLGKSFEITYIRLQFYTSRPESFAIYRRTEEDGPWLPYQYYSGSCRKTYRKETKGYIRPGDDERTALCTDEFSDISPLTGGNVAFSTLEGRPSAYNFDQSLVLQEWVTATDLLISLDRLNTFGDEFFKDAKVLRSYFYAISDFSVGGRCKCNGHASECVEGEQGGLVCVCQHHTVGADCQRCHPFYQDRPWARATGDSANECLRCNCSGRSEECVFDLEQYRSTGSGGRCVNCRDNTDGPHCERCLEYHTRKVPEEPCVPCNCNINGSVSLQCDVEGRCLCRVGVTGEKCDTCQAGFHSLGPGGCRLHEYEKRFEPHLSAFEFQHLLYNLTALKISNAGGHNYTSQLAGVTLTSASIASHPNSPPALWVESCSCPRGLAGQFCERCTQGFTREDSSRGLLSACVPCNCHHHGPCHPETGACECSDFTSGTTCEHCLDGYYGNALIGTPADCQPCPCPDRSSCAQIAQTGQVVCTNCPAGQTGTRCQMCEDGYYGDPLGTSGMVQPCVRCSCNGNVDFNSVGVCDHITGRCLRCLGHTEGDHCQRCQQGFYGDALNQTAGQKCKPCGCSSAGTSGHVNECHPQTGNCHCLSHVTGRDCSHCEVGFFNLQPGMGCERCKCNPIGSLSSVCHPTTGECVCRAGVEGRLCDICRASFFGFSLRGCEACNCDPVGSVSMQCHSNGTCKCRQGFVGYKCDQCELNYFHNRATHQCDECPVCYGLVKKQAKELRTRLQDLEKLLAHFDCRGRSAEQHLLLKYHMARLYELHHQREDTFPNALEDFLAFQEAREAFIKQFSLLGASAGTLLAQLHGITFTLNCSIGVTEGEGEDIEEDKRSRRVCQTLTETALVIRASEKQLQQATLDLDHMIIPFEAMSAPNKWNIMVNDSQVLMKSHKEVADHIEAVASRVVQVSNRTFSLLMDLLQDNSTEEYIMNLTEKITEMQQLKKNLTSELNNTEAEHLALEEENVGLKLALGNITSSLPWLGLMDSRSEMNGTEFNQTHPTNTTEWGENFQKQTEELDQQIQKKENLISEISEKLEPLIRAAKRSLEKVEDIKVLQAHTQEATAVSLSSVVMGKEVESEAFSLHREVENMVAQWPHQQAQTRAAVKKVRPLEDKVLVEVRKTVQKVEKALEAAVENSNLVINTTKEAEHIAQAAAQESKTILAQAKHTKTASTQLNTQLDAELQKLSEQELLLKEATSHVTSEPAVSLTSMKEAIEAAKLQLEAYSSTLSELISKIDGSVPLERFDRILNETERRLSMLRGSVESPALSSKIQRLRTAAKEQQSRLSLIEQDIQEIREERDSLRDIASNLPQSCPRARGEA